jgi:hypothetical protein
LSQNGLYIVASTPKHNYVPIINHWAVLYLDVSISVTSTSGVLPGPLPSGLVIALPVAFNLNITNSSALSSGSIRIFYNQASIASQVNEDDMVPLRWNDGTSSWVPTTSGLSRSQNWVDIPLSQNGLYIIASTPKQNYIPIIIIVLIGITGGIVAAAGYSYSRKKKVQQKVVKGKGKDSLSTSYTGVPPTTTEIPYETLAKRARLMQIAEPSTSPRPSAVTLFGSVEQTTEPVEAVKKKAGSSSEPDVDIAARADRAQKMASEVRVESVLPRCIVHKGPISGFSYSCKSCGVVYCVKCMKHLAKTNQDCWNCGARLETDDEQARPEAAARDETEVSVLSEDVWNRIEKLGLQEDILDEVLGKLKTLPPNDRMAYLERVFPDEEEYDGKL